MASLDRQVTQNGLWVNNAMVRRIYNGCRRGYRQWFVNGEVVNVDDDLAAMMNGGVLDVEPFLISRNTLGNGKTANSKSQTSNVKWW